MESKNYDKLYNLIDQAITLITNYAEPGDYTLDILGDLHRIRQGLIENY